MSTSADCTAVATTLDCSNVQSGTTLTISVKDGAGTVIVNPSMTTSATGVSQIVIVGGSGNDVLENLSNIPTTFAGGAGDEVVQLQREQHKAWWLALHRRRHH